MLVIVERIIEVVTQPTQATPPETKRSESMSDEAELVMLLGFTFIVLLIAGLLWKFIGMSYFSAFLTALVGIPAAIWGLPRWLNR